ncbi:hypothetical protein R3W88_002139 [Solanum pinnatisectum]|uniref:Uncharacterized protein n=1 Tax=Solanum pinnatisectum TaxID=50273 RepID=A0AAV9MK76_9SOLN|nr:hypothetical protein R3W88_002139 [Solanum pinnatisectum]
MVCELVEFEVGTSKHYLNLKSNNVDVVLVVDVSLPVCPSRCLLHFTDVIIPFYYSFSFVVILQDKENHFMDKKESGKEISEEVTRESLIAISYSEPEIDPSIESVPENSNYENVVKSLNDIKDDKYRSELISISYAESPDTEVQPGEFKG